MADLGTDKDVLDHLGIGRTSLYELLADSRRAGIVVPAYLILRSRRWRMDEVLPWADEVSQWRRSKSAAVDIESDGGTAKEERTAAPVRTVARRRSSNAKSSSPSPVEEIGALTTLL